jgi:MFS family permease
VAWGVGLLGGPALGGFLFERMGFAWLALVWSPVLIVVTVLLARVNPEVRLKPDTTTDDRTRSAGL